MKNKCIRCQKKKVFARGLCEMCFMKLELILKEKKKK